MGYLKTDSRKMAPIVYIPHKATLADLTREAPRLAKIYGYSSANIGKDSSGKFFFIMRFDGE